jgi:hypothetical protein
MANSDKDIRIQTNRNKSGLPNISFTGYNNDPIVLNVLDDNTVSFEGSSGQLFSVSNAVTTGTIFSVNDISGIPSFRIDADGTVGIAEFSGNVGIGLQSPQSKLSVGGDINAGAGYTFKIAGSKVLDSSGLGTGVTSSSLTSVGTISSGSWQGSPVGVLYGGTGASDLVTARTNLGAATAGTNSDITRMTGLQHLFVTIPTAAAIGITVKAATSQSANMVEFVNSSNSVLSWITKDGTFAYGAYFTHSDGRIPGFSVQKSGAAGIVARGFNSANYAAIEVQDNPGALVVGLYPSGLVYGGVLQAYSSTASTSTTTGALIVAGGAGIAGTIISGSGIRIFSSTASSSPFTGALIVSGGVGISKELYVGGGVAFTATIGSTSATTGTLVVSGGVGIGGTLFSSSSYANSLSGVVLDNGSVSLTGTYTQSNSSTTAFSVKDGSNTTAFNIDTISDVVSLPIAVASTSTGSGSLVVAGGVGIGGSVFIGNSLSVGSSAASTSTTTGALIVSGGVGIGGSVYSSGRFNFGTLSAPTMSSFAGVGTGALTPSTTYYYKASAIDFNNNESLPSIEYSVTTSASTYGVRFYIFPVNGAVGYKLYRTTTSGSYTDSYVQTYRINQYVSAYYLYDVGKTTSTGTPLSTPTGNTATLGSNSTVPSNTLPSLTIPSGALQVKSPNFTGYAPTSRGVSIETGAYDFVQVRDPYGYNFSVSASTGGTLTAGQTYYYVFTCLDHYGNESLPSQEIAFTADSGGAATFSFSVATVQQATRRWYRTTTPGNYTNSYIGELYDHKDINFPTKNVSPPTTTQFAGARILPAPDFGQYSFFPNIDVAPSSRNGAIRKIGTPYSGTLTLTTSGTAGSLLPNTTYYYKFVEVDIFGGSTYPSQEYSIGTGTSTAVTINASVNLWIEAKNYTKIYRSTTSNSYSNVPTYIVNSFPFTDLGDTTFTETPPSSATNIQGQLFVNGSGLPQNYLISLAIGPPSNSAPFSILAAQNAISSVSASTGGTLTSGQVYYYVMEPRDVYNLDGVALQPVRFVATAGGAALITPGQILGANGYVYYNIFRSTTLASWSNTLIATAVRGNFVDLNYPTRSGSPNFGYHRARSIVLGNTGSLFVPSFVNQTYGQNLTQTSTPYRTGGNSSGTLTTNTTYYYRVLPFGYNSAWGYASDEFVYTTGANEKNISLSIGGHKTGAMGYRVYRSTSFNDFTNAYYFETQHSDFTDLGFSTLQATPYIASLINPAFTTANRLDQANGNVLVNTVITGQNGALKIHMKSPSALSLSSGTGGTLATNTDYFYRVEAVDAYASRSFPSEEAWINTGSNNAVTITWNEVPGAYYYRIYRTTTSQSYTNTLIASYVNSRTFTDLNYPITSGTPYSFSSHPGTNAAAIFQIDNAKNYGVMPRTVISNINSTQSSWNTDFSLRITSPPVGSSSAALLQVGAGFTNNSSSGFAGTTYGTQIAIGAATGFTGSLLDAQTAGVSRYKINFDGSTSIGSTTGSGSTSTGALVITGGVGIGQSLNTSTAYASSISGAIFSNGSATLSGTFTQNNTSTTAFRVNDASSSTVLNIDTQNDIVSLPIAIASTNTSTGSLIVAGGVGISGQLTFSQASFGFTGISTNPTMSFIGATSSSPITLTVLTDNSLIFEGSSGKLFGINNNLSTGWIFNIGDISGLPILRANANSNIAMGEFGGNVAIGISNPAYKLHVAGAVGITASTSSSSTSTGALVVSGGVGIGQSLSVGGRLQLFNGSNYTAFQSAASGDTTYTLPATSPATGTSYLTSNSSGVMSWTAPSKSNYVLSFGAGFTPTANSADSVSLNIPYEPDGTAKYYYIKRIEYRNETLSGGTGLSFYIQRHTSGNASWSTTNTITAGSGASFEVGASVYSASFTTINSSAGIAGSVISGDYVRLFFTVVGSAANVSIAMTIEEQ